MMVVMQIQAKATSPASTELHKDLCSPLGWVGLLKTSHSTTGTEINPRYLAKVMLAPHTQPWGGTNTAAARTAERVLKQQPPK